MNKAVFLCFILAAAAVTTSCKPRQPSAEYLAICEGPPIHGDTERREQVMQEGLEIDPYHDCVTKRSVAFLAAEKAKWEAANTPEAKAARQAEFERKAAEGRTEREAQAREQAAARAERERRWAEEEAKPIQAVEINTATESELASVQGMDADMARQIVSEREKGRFKDWPDVVHRVVALSAAQTAARASGFGLTVNGRSLEGAEPGSGVARYLREQWRRRAES